LARRRTRLAAVLALAPVVLGGCATGLVRDEVVSPAWEWASRDKLVVTFHAPATDDVVVFDAGIELSGALPELRGRERQALLASASDSGNLHPGDRAIACFETDLGGQLPGPAAPVRRLLVARNRDGAAFVLLEGSRGWERCAVDRLIYTRAAGWKEAVVTVGAVPLCALAIPIDIGLAVLHGLDVEF